MNRMFDIVDQMLHDSGNCVALTPLVGLGMAAGGYATDRVLEGNVPGFASDGTPFPVVAGVMEAPFETALAAAFRLAYTWENAADDPERNPSLRACLLNHAHDLSGTKVKRAVQAAVMAGFAYGYEEEGEEGYATSEEAQACLEPLVEIIAGLTGLAWWAAAYEVCAYAEVPVPTLSVSPLVAGVIRTAKNNSPDKTDTMGRILIAGIGTSAGAWAFAIGAVAGHRAYRDEPALTSADVVRGYKFHPIDAIAIGAVSDLKVDLFDQDEPCDCPNCRAKREGEAEVDDVAAMFNEALREAGGGS